MIIDSTIEDLKATLRNATQQGALTPDQEVLADRLLASLEKTSHERVEVMHNNFKAARLFNLEALRNFNKEY